MGRMRRAVTAVLIALGAIGALTGVAAPAPPASAAPAPAVLAAPAGEGTWISYTGTLATARAAAGGAGVIITVACAAEGACTLTLATADGAASYTWPATARGEGRFDGPIPAQGDPCASDPAAIPAGAFALVADPATATLGLDFPDTPVECPETSVTYPDRSVTASFTAGFVCVLTGIPCPPAEPAPAEPAPDTPVDETPPSPDAPVADAPADDVPVLAAPPRGVAAGTALASGEATAPSILWTLPTLAQAPLTAIQLALAAAIAIVLVLLVAFPTALLNSAVEAAPERVARLLRRTPRPPPTRSHRAFGGAWWFAALGVLIAAALAGFVDPEFGWNPGSLRVALGILIGFVVDVVLGWGVVVAVARSLDRRAVIRYRFAPLSLAVVIAAVVFTRVTGFEPGIVFGLVAGVVVGTVASVAVRGRSALALACYALGIGLAAWALYSLLGPVLAASPTLIEALAVDALAATAIAGVAAGPIVLVPLRGLAGGDVFAWSRGGWAALYAVAMFAFLFVLMPMPFSWSEVGMSLLAWIWIYAAYAVVAVVLWLVIARPWRRDDDGDDAPAARADRPALRDR